MKTYAVYLNPKGTFKGWIHSDTIFGAICWAIRAIYGVSTLEAMLANFSDTPKFLLSSSFPYIYRDETKIHFYSKPMLADLTSEQVYRFASERKRRFDKDPLAQKRAVVEIIDKAKWIKGVSFVSETLFEEIVRGEKDTGGLLQKLMVRRGTRDDDIEKIGDALVTTGERKKVDSEGEFKAFWKVVDLQRNEVDRLARTTVEGRLFYSQETASARGLMGLWFILQTDDLDFVTPALRYLEDTGIGGDRSVGKGNFKIELGKEFNIPVAEDANAFVTLSRYLPSNGEWDSTKRPLSYALTVLRPKHESRFSSRGHRTYKRLLRLFAPGSIFPLGDKKKIWGRIVPVGISADEGGWQVWHTGLAIVAFAKIGGD